MTPATKLTEADREALREARAKSPAALQARIASLTAENERLREALKPFADCVVHLHPLHDPEAETLDGIKVREWRAAYAALQSKENDQ